MIENLQKVPSVLMTRGGNRLLREGSKNEWAGGAGEAVEAWEEAQETLGAFGAGEVVAEGPAEEGPAWAQGGRLEDHSQP
jgi:hypothetical protein